MNETDRTIVALFNALASLCLLVDALSFLFNSILQDLTRHTTFLKIGMNLFQPH
jgi:hypothetical protein